jgi:RNA polymerase sigma-B factor
MLRLLPEDSQVANLACELLVDRYQSLVKSCVKKYEKSPEPHEDLMQAGYVGLVKAINDFDPAIGRNLAAFARPCISGEIKRHFRDTRFQVHVPRPVQELRLKIRQARIDLTLGLSRSPRDRQLARRLGISDAELLEAQRAEQALQALSLDAPLSGEPDAASLAEFLGGEDPQFEHALDMQAVWSHIGELPAREQRLLMMRFYGNMTQREIGGRLGISQMHVSRLRAHPGDGTGNRTRNGYQSRPLCARQTCDAENGVALALRLNDPHGSFAVAADRLRATLENLRDEAEATGQAWQVEHLKEGHGRDEQPQRRVDQPCSNGERDTAEVSERSRPVDLQHPGAAHQLELVLLRQVYFGYETMVYTLRNQLGRHPGAPVRSINPAERPHIRVQPVSGVGSFPARV